MAYANKSALVLALTTALSMACGDDAGGDKESAAAITQLLPAGYERAQAPRFSPDSDRLAMVVSVGEDQHLITTDLEGGDIVVLATSGLTYLSTIAWMPDGEALVFGGDGGITRIGADGADATLLVDAFAVSEIDVSPDGQRIAWSTNGSPTFVSAPLDSIPVPSAEQVVGPEGRAARYSFDGERLAYVVSTGFATSTATGENAENVDAATDYLSNVAWMDDETIVGLTDFGVTQFDVATGSSTEVYEQFAAMSLDVSPDASMFVLGVNGTAALQLGSF